MDVLRDFEIEFIKLKEGTHHFEYQITDAFFKAFDSSLSAQDLQVSLQFTKTHAMFTLVFEVSGTVNTDCDRCLSSIGLPLTGRHTVLVKITEHPMESEDDLIYLTPGDYKLNIAQHVYDFICLSIPIKKTCTDVGLECDPEVTAKIDSMIDYDTSEPEQPDQDTDEEEDEE